MKIAVAGTGYVGLSMAVLLAQNHEVTAVDVIPEKVELLQKGRSPIRDKEIKEYLAGGRLHLQATLDGEVAYRDAELVIVSTPTNYDPGIHFFDTGSVETVVETVRRVNPDAVIVIKSTVPVGYTVSLMEKYHTDSPIGFTNRRFRTRFTPAVVSVRNRSLCQIPAASL